MDLRQLPDGLSPKGRCDERRTRVESELGVDLSALSQNEEAVGQADEKNCEQMLGAVPLPVGYAGPLDVTFSSGERTTIHLPLATTEGALVASVNRGCKALSLASNVKTQSKKVGVSRSIAFLTENSAAFTESLKKREEEWTRIAEATSDHLQIMDVTIDESDDHVFLTIFCDTDEAMGMNMVTIAAQAIADWVEKELHTRCVTIAGNVDSDKKPSTRVHEEGRGFTVTAEVTIPETIIKETLKTTPEDLLAVAKAKLELGSSIAGAIGHNLHAANIIAALYLATGQDAAHVVEGSLTDTSVAKEGDGVRVTVRCPAILVGVRGGGTQLPAQSQCLAMFLKQKTSLHPSTQLAESVAAAILAGEVSLLAAQASKSLAKAHEKLAR